jgi:hypothetical protein
MSLLDAYLSLDDTADDTPVSGRFGFAQAFDGGGVGNSGPSTTEQKTESNDMRVVGADGSVNSSFKLDVSGDNAAITTTDYGAVAGSLKLAGDTVHDGYTLALHGIDAANAQTAATVAANGSLLTGALQMTADNGKTTLDTLKDLKSADVRVLAGVGMAVVGLAAVALLARKG